MKLNDLQDALGQIDDSLVTEAGRARGKKKPPLWHKIGAVAAAIALVLTSIMIIQGTRQKNIAGSDVMALATPEYPTIHKRPSDELLYGSESDQQAYDKAFSLWSADFQKQRNQPQGYKDGVISLTRKTNRLLLTSDGENRVYSPLNIYLALSLMAETTGGDTREEILQVLSVDTIEMLRKKAGSLWQAHYMNDGYTTSLLANSIWFDNKLSIKKETMKILQDIYKAAAFQGDMSSSAMTEQLQKWLNEQTDNLLESSVENEGFDEDTLMALASTILFRARWNDEFNEGNTGKSIFHSPAGSIETDFMSESKDNTYYWGDKFAAICKGLTYSGSMWFFLPDEGVNVNELLDDPQVDAILQNCMDYDQQKFLIVNFKVPKFDVMSEIQLGQALQDLGITKAFTASADFSPTSEDAGLFVSDASHAARVMIDENGVTGAAYTLIYVAACKPPDETVDFVLDRPFLFVVQGHDGVPLFVGVVNQP